MRKNLHCFCPGHNIQLQCDIRDREAYAANVEMLFGQETEEKTAAGPLTTRFHVTDVKDDKKRGRSEGRPVKWAIQSRSHYQLAR